MLVTRAESSVAAFHNSKGVCNRLCCTYMRLELC